MVEEPKPKSILKKEALKYDQVFESNPDERSQMVVIEPSNSSRLIEEDQPKQ